MYIRGRFPKPILILYETVLTVAQTEQFAAAEEEENLVVPDEFPQDAAHTDLLLGGEFLTGDGGVIIEFIHLVLLESHLDKLVTEVDESDACGVVAAVHHHIDSVSELLVVVEEMNGIGVVIHSCFIL